MNEYNNLNDDKQLILTPDKKRTRTRIIKCAAGTAAVAAVCAVSIAAVPQLRNSVKMAFSSPEDYFAGVLRSYALDNSGKAADIYKKYCDSAEKEKSEKGTLIFEPGSEAAEDLGLKEGIKLGLDYNVSVKGSTAASTAGLSVDGNELIDVSAVAANDTFYLGFPTISPAWMYASAEDLRKEMLELTVSRRFAERPEITILDGTVLTRERAERITGRYTDIYLKYAGDVTITKNREFTSQSGLTVKYNDAAVTLDTGELYDMCAEMLDAAKDDEDLLAVWNACGYTSEEYDEYISDAIGSMGERPDGTEGKAEIHIYIGSDGKIKGQKLTLTSDGEDQNGFAELSSMLFVKGTEFAFEAAGNYESSYSYKDFDVSYSSDSASKTELSLSGTYQKGKYSGSGKLTSESSNSYTSDDFNNSSGEAFNVDIEFSDVDGKALGSGSFDGSVKLSGGSVDVDDDYDDENVKFTVSLAGNENSADFALEISEDDEKLFGLTVSAESADYTEPEIPTENIYSLLDDEEVKEYLRTVDMNKFRDNVENARSALGDDFADDLIEFADEIEEEFNDAREKGAAGGNINW